MNVPLGSAAALAMDPHYHDAGADADDGIVQAIGDAIFELQCARAQYELWQSAEFDARTRRDAMLSSLTAAALAVQEAIAEAGAEA